ncbi:MAG: hypothetical protein LAT64_04660 [Phycisphaerales bacterium]|nr:hypothetical protein [Planctomycetota bacterium]MCH8508045.1 hypothetical protein [Phycisphaerales bacterium]
MQHADMSTARQTDAATRTPWWPVLAVVGAFLAAALPLIGSGFERGRGAFDQVHYHEPAVLRFAEQFPRPDVSDYLSATTPAYHLILAVPARAVSDDPGFLRLVGALFTVALLVLLTRWLTPRVGPWPAVAMGLSLPASLYVFSAGAFILPDNMAWTGVLAILLIALRPRFDRVTLLAGGGVLLALVLTRQNHLWAAGALLAAAWLGSAFRPRPGPLAEIHSLFDAPAERLGRTGLMALCLLPAFGAVAAFVAVWGGLTVPIYHDYMQGVNPATPAFILAQIGVIGVFHAGYWLRPGLDLLRERRALLLLAALGGLLLAAVPPTTYSVEAGRYSGLWNAVRAAPVLFGHSSTLLLVLAPVGAVTLAAWLAGVGPRARWILLGTLFGFTLAVSMTLNAWQRYHEPMLLMNAALLSALCAVRERERPDRAGPPAPAMLRRARLAGPLLLVALLGAINLNEHRRAEPVGPPLERKEGIERPLRDLWPDNWRRLESR